MNTPELHVEPKLPVLAFNFDQLKAWAEGLTARYAELVVTEEAVAEVKRDMAELSRQTHQTREGMSGRGSRTT